jgi:hypothetical protein
METETIVILYLAMPPFSLFPHVQNFTERN